MVSGSILMIEEAVGRIWVSTYLLLLFISISLILMTLSGRRCNSVFAK